MEQPLFIVGAMSIVLFAGFTQGLTSFGFALIAMPFFSKLIELNQAVPMVVILSLCTNLIVIRGCYRFIDIKKIWLLIVASLAGAPCGALVLMYVHPDTVKFAAGVLITIFSATLLLGKSFPLRNERIAFLPIGFLSGFLNGSISMSGPPVALFMSNQNTGKNAFRANITFYAIFLNVVTIVIFAMNRLITGRLIANVALLIPGLLIGVVFGNYATRKIDEFLFKKIALVLMVATGLWTMVGVFKG